VATTSAAQPLSLLVAGVSSQISLAAALQAARATYCHVVGTLSADGGLTQGRSLRWAGIGQGGLAEFIARLPDLDPDVILLCGGSDGGTMAPLVDLAQAILAARAKPPKELNVVFAGNKDARQAITGILAGQVDLRVGDNVAPSPNRLSPEPTSHELEALYCERKIARLPGYELLTTWSRSALSPAATTFTLMLRYLARQYDFHVLGIDIGAQNTVIAFAQGDSLDKQVHTNLGIINGSEQIRNSGGAAAIARWLPFQATTTQIEDYLANRQARPWAIPQSAEEVWLDQALACEILRSMAEVPQQADLIVGSGGVLAHARRPGQAALTLLNALEPVGLIQLAIDTGLMLPALGACVSVQPQAAAEALVIDGLVPIATVVAPIGWGREGRLALRVGIRTAYGKALQVDVPFGALERVSLEPGEKVRLELRPARGFDVGLGPGQGALAETEVHGLGLLIDCRGRPLLLPAEPEECLARVREWAIAVGAWG